MKDEILTLIDSYWKFDSYQQPISSWHDKQDLLDEVNKVFDAQKNNTMLCGYYEPCNKTSSARKCKCGREEWEHPKPRN